MPPVLLTTIGIVFLVAGAYVLVEGASRFAFAFGVSELVVGLTIVAIGTSAPELAVSVVSAMQQRSGEIDNGSALLIGNVVGSNIANIGLILGLSAFVASIAVPKSILERDFLWLLGASVLVGVFAWDGHFVFLEGVILMIGMVAFSIFQYRIAMQESEATNKEREASGVVVDKSVRTLGFYVVLILIGVVGLVLGSNWLVEGSTQIARDLGISEFLIGLTLVAVGTSLPELATSVVASMRGEGQIVVGNIIGSNIYNLLLILAAGMMITDLDIPDQVRTVQIPLMVGLTFALYPIIRSSHHIQKKEGALLLVAYVAITAAAFIVNPAS